MSMKTRLFENLIKSVRDMVDDLTFDDLIRIVAGIKDLFDGDSKPDDKWNDMVIGSCDNCSFNFYFERSQYSKLHTYNCPKCDSINMKIKFKNI